MAKETPSKDISLAALQLDIPAGHEASFVAISEGISTSANIYSRTQNEQILPVPHGNKESPQKMSGTPASETAPLDVLSVEIPLPAPRLDTPAGAAGPNPTRQKAQSECGVTSATRQATTDEGSNLNHRFTQDSTQYKITLSKEMHAQVEDIYKQVEGLPVTKKINLVRDKILRIKRLCLNENKNINNFFKGKLTKLREEHVHNSMSQRMKNMEIKNALKKQKDSLEQAISALESQQAAIQVKKIELVRIKTELKDLTQKISEDECSIRNIEEHKRYLDESIPKLEASIANNPTQKDVDEKYHLNTTALRSHFSQILRDSKSCESKILTPLQNQLQELVMFGSFEIGSEDFNTIEEDDQISTVDLPAEPFRIDEVVHTQSSQDEETVQPIAVESGDVEEITTECEFLAENAIACAASVKTSRVGTNSLPIAKTYTKPQATLSNANATSQSCTISSVNDAAPTPPNAALEQQRNKSSEIGSNTPTKKNVPSKRSSDIEKETAKRPRHSKKASKTSGMMQERVEDTGATSDSETNEHTQVSDCARGVASTSTLNESRDESLTTLEEKVKKEFTNENWSSSAVDICFRKNVFTFGEKSALHAFMTDPEFPRGKNTDSAVTRLLYTYGETIREVKRCAQELREDWKPVHHPGKLIIANFEACGKFPTEKEIADGCSEDFTRKQPRLLLNAGTLGSANVIKEMKKFSQKFSTLSGLVARLRAELERFKNPPKRGRRPKKQEKITE